MNVGTANLFGYNLGHTGLIQSNTITTNATNNVNKITGFIPAQASSYTISEIRYRLNNVTGSVVAGDAKLILRVDTAEQASLASPTNTYTNSGTMAVGQDLIFTTALTVPAGSTVIFSLNNTNATPASNFYGVARSSGSLGTANHGYINSTALNKVIQFQDSNSAVIGGTPPAWIAITSAGNFGLGIVDAVESALINSSNTIGVQFTSPNCTLNVIGAIMYLKRTSTSSTVAPRYKLKRGTDIIYTASNVAPNILGAVNTANEPYTPIAINFVEPLSISPLTTCQLTLEMPSGETTNGFNTVVQEFNSIVGTTLTRVQGLGYLAPGSSTPDNNRTVPFALILDDRQPLGAEVGALTRQVAYAYWG